MNIWYISLYEPLPIQSVQSRRMRSMYLTNSLLDKGHEVHLFVQNYDHVTRKIVKGHETMEYVSKNFTVVYLRSIIYKSDRSILRFLHFISLSISFLKISKNLNHPDLIITQIPSLELASAVSKFAILNNIKYVVDIRDPYPDNYLRLFGNNFEFLYRLIFIWHRKILKYILTNANAVTAVSKEYLDWAASKIDNPKTNKLCYFPIGFQDLDVCNTELNHDSLNLVFAGTFEDNIDLSTIVSASLLAYNKYRLNVMFYIAGVGPGSDILLNNQPNLKHLGWLNQTDLMALYATMDIGLVSYSSCALQSIPNKPFEYMNNRLAIINSISGELSSIVDEFQIGLNYSAGNAQSLLLCIDKFFSDKCFLNRCKDNSHRLFKSKYTVDCIYPSFVKFLESC